MWVDKANLGSERAASVHTHMVAGIRLVLSFSALLVVFIDPAEPNRLVYQTYAAIISYTVYSLLIYLAVLTNREFSRTWTNSYWVDVGWYFLLISLSSGTSSTFFFFFYFAIINSSFTKGFRAGVQVAAVSAIGFTIVGYLSSGPGIDDFDRFLLRPLSLLVLGYMIAFWGGNQTRTVNRLKMLREIGLLSNPRFGVERTIGVNMELLRKFFRADSCLVVTVEGEADGYKMRFCDDADPEGGLKTKAIDPGLGERLMSLPECYGAMYAASLSSQVLRTQKLHAYNCSNRKSEIVAARPFIELAETLDARSYLTAPVFYRGEFSARVFLASQKRWLFETSDIDFLLQAIDHFTPIVENIRLIDRMASDAADDERRKIALDIHDSVIQPYIGLQMGIDSLKSALEGGGDTGPTPHDLKDRIGRLQELAREGVEDLRRYVRGLADGRAREANLLLAIRRFAEKFGEATGIDIKTELSDGIPINDRLAAEVFQIIAEGLSNVRRHTQSPEAMVRLAMNENKLAVAIVNRTDQEKFQPFTPRSITERAASLGGTVAVGHSGRETEVLVEIPL